ncbi:MAG TPA: hypothetical protein VNO30_39675 [Kofleriaceae bacterium]|nr:hypothetical protein [Kofleriaceae bacterium]
MNCRKSLWLGLGLALTASAPVAAQNAPEEDASTGDTSSEDAPAEEPEPDPVAQAKAMQSRIDELEARLESAERVRRARFPVKITGYGDLGFFATSPGGDGSGFRRDAGHVVFPMHSQIAWVFWGDLLATMVNSRGDVADLGEAPGVDRFDSVNAENNPSFLVNELSIGINAGLGERALFTSSVNFTPRTGTDFRLGDSFDVDVAQLEWLPFADGHTSVFIGKVDSVIGIEYKTRKAPQRFGITPTLLARYTTGPAVGLKARSKFLNERLILAASVTNGSFGTEQFHFHSEVDTNAFKTVSGRVAVRLKIAGGTFEAGPSGQWGTQDGAPDGADKMWTAGVDAEFETSRFGVRAQWLKAKAPGDAVSQMYSLDLKNGGYLEANFLVTPIIGLLGRAEFRDAQVQQGMERLYITKNWRATAGLRLIFNPNAIIKAEYSHNGEYGGLPSIPDDVVTTSAVMAF